SVYNNTVYLWVLGSDGYVYQSIGGGTFTVVSTAGADHIFAWPGQNLATYSVGNTLNTTLNTGYAALPSGVTVKELTGS
ncbi:hypothetical protein ACO1NI_14240, partial [Staphylococcus aureus]